MKVITVLTKVRGLARLVSFSPRKVCWLNSILVIYREIEDNNEMLACYSPDQWLEVAKAEIFPDDKGVYKLPPDETRLSTDFPNNEGTYMNPPDGSEIHRDKHPGINPDHSWPRE